MYWQVQTLTEFLKIVLKHVSECLNFIRAQAHLFKVLYKDELIDLQCFKQYIISN